MHHMFDIFKRLPDGTPLWIEAAPSLSEAKQRVARMADDSQNEYFIFSVHDGGIVSLVTGTDQFGTLNRWPRSGETIH